jgi:O-antigen ligase
MSAGRRSSPREIATWLAAALTLMPFLQMLPVDFDRSGTLFLLLPALWAGRREAAAAVARFFRGPLPLRVAFAVASVAVVVSVARAGQPAPAVVETAAWILLAMAGLIAGEIVRADPRAGTRLLAGLALGAALGTVATWSLWLLSGRGTMPLYAHHRHLGLHTLPAAVASTALLIAPRASRRGRGAALALGAICWGGLLWSGGRGPVLALGAALGVWFVVRASQRRALFAASAAQLVAGLALSSLFWTTRPELGWWHALGRTATAAASAASTGSTSELTSTRTDFWRETIERARSAPWFGHGPDSYRYLTPKLDGQQPHNLVLQLWLDLGIAGALPLLGIVAFALWRGGRTVRFQADDNTSPVAAWLAVLVASVMMGLLDGTFYHLLAFLPAMLAAGIALSASLPASDATLTSKAFAAAIGSFAVVIAVAVLALHSWLFQALAVAPPPRPDGAAARALRVFPSATFGLWRWLDAWQEYDAAVALDWARWAQGHSASAPLFHVYAARMLRAQGAREAAEAELLAARAKAHWTTRPTIDALLREFRATPP